MLTTYEDAPWREGSRSWEWAATGAGEAMCEGIRLKRTSGLKKRSEWIATTKRCQRIAK